MIVIVLAVKSVACIKQHKSGICWFRKVVYLANEWEPTPTTKVNKMKMVTMMMAIIIIKYYREVVLTKERRGKRIEMETTGRSLHGHLLDPGPNWTSF